MLVSCVLIALAWLTPSIRPIVEAIGIQALVCVQIINMFVGYPVKDWLVVRFMCPGPGGKVLLQHMFLDMIFMPVVYAGLIPDATREQVLVGLIWLTGFTCFFGLADAVFSYFGQPLLRRRYWP